MIAWVNARLMLMCDGCYRRWPMAKTTAPGDTLAVPLAEDGTHLCDVCRKEPLA